MPQVKKLPFTPQEIEESLRLRAERLEIQRIADEAVPDEAAPEESIVPLAGYFEDFGITHVDPSPRSTSR